MIAKQQQKVDNSRSVSDTVDTAAPPYFPPPPQAPNRNRGNPPTIRVGLPANPRASPSRLSNDSDMSSTYGGVENTPPQAHAGGLRPPPSLHTRRSLTSTYSASLDKTTDKEKEIDNQEEESISPLLSRAPPLPAPSSTNTTSNPRPSSSPPPTPYSPTDDVIPAEHKRIPGLIPRSPILTLSGLGIVAKRVVGPRKPVPAPILVVHPPSSQTNEESTFDLGKMGLKSPAAVSVAGSIVVSPVLPVPVHTKQKEKSKRRTMWGLVEGWWDLGLLERMGTVRRKR